jgi:hypothetical protein
VSKFIEIVSKTLTKEQIIIIEDEMDKVLEMSPELVATIQRLHANKIAQQILGIPQKCPSFGPTIPHAESV